MFLRRVFGLATKRDRLTELALHPSGDHPLPAGLKAFEEAIGLRLMAERLNAPFAKLNVILKAPGSVPVTWYQPPVIGPIAEVSIALPDDAGLDRDDAAARAAIAEVLVAALDVASAAERWDAGRVIEIVRDVARHSGSYRLQAKEPILTDRVGGHEYGVDLAFGSEGVAAHLGCRAHPRRSRIVAAYSRPWASLMAFGMGNAYHQLRAQADHLEFRHRDGSLTLAVPRPDCTPIPGDVSPDGSLDSLVGRVVRAVRRWHPVDRGGEVDFDTGDLGLEFDGFDARLHGAADSEIAVRISALGGIEHAEGVPFDTWWAFDSSYPVGSAPSMVGSTILAVERDAVSGVVRVAGSAATLTLSVTASGLRVEPDVRVRVQAIPW